MRILRPSKRVVKRKLAQASKADKATEFGLVTVAGGRGCLQRLLPTPAGLNTAALNDVYSPRNEDLND